jgi:hypothetical protein
MRLGLGGCFHHDVISWKVKQSGTLLRAGGDTDQVCLRFKLLLGSMSA